MPMLPYRAPETWNEADRRIGRNLEQGCERTVQAAGVIVIAVGALVLLGWAFDIALLKSLIPGAANMKPNTAVSFMLLGMSLLALQRAPDASQPRVWRHVSLAGAILVDIIALLTLAEYLFGLDMRVDTLLFPTAPSDLHTSHPGRMAPATAVGFLCASTALLLLHGNSRPHHGLAQFGALATILSGLVAIIGYIFDIEGLYRFYSLASVALHTAIMFVILGVGIMLARREHGFSAIVVSVDSGGFLARRILPAAVLVPFMIGWLRLQGEYAGFYSTAMGVAMLTTANVAVFVVLIWLSAGTLNRKDAEQRRVQHALQQSEQRLRNIIDGLSPNMFVGLLTLDGAVLEANQQALAAAGLKSEDVLGKPVEETYWFSYSEASKQLMRDMVTRAARGEASRCDLQIRATENQYIDLDFSMQPFHDASGKVTLLVPSAIVITERKRTEDALRESQQTLQLTLDAAQIGYWDLDLVTHNATRSFMHDKVFGYDTPPDWSHEMFLTHVHPEDRARVDRLFQEGVAAKTQWDFECRIIRADGAHHWIWGYGKVFTNPAGEAVRMLGMVSDITHRKQAEKAFQESAANLQLALDAAHMGIYDWDVQTNRIIWSRWHEELWGYTPGEFNGTYEGFAQRVNPDDLQTIEDKIARCIAERTHYQGEFRVIWPDSSVHWIAGRGEFTFDDDGKPLRMRGVVVEITERKKAEALVRESERNLAEAQRITHVGSWRWDLSGPVQWTDELYRIYGVSPETFTPTIESFFELMHPEDRPTMQAWLQACIEGKGVDDFEYRAVRPDCAVRYISGRGELIVDANGGPILMVGTAQDITQRKHAELALLEAKCDMERKVLERTAELNATRLELQAKNEALVEQNRRVEEATRLKSEFLANMSHELRTPLNAIIGFSELMHDGKVGPIAANHKEYLGDVLTSAHHLLQLINDVLDLAKVESGKMEFFYAQMDLRKILNEVCDVLRTLMSRTHTRVSIEIGDGLDEVWVDASKLKQVLYNYLSNAMKFSHEGGLIVVRARREGPDAYRIEVEDRGIGIKPEDLSRLFTEFQQLDLSPSKKYQGTGLGLALTKRIIEAQGGRVGVESLRDIGSVFYMILPMQPAPTEVAS